MVGVSLTETEEKRVHTHAKNTEEAAGDDVGPQDGGLEDTGLLGFLCGIRGCDREEESLTMMGSQ